MKKTKMLIATIVLTGLFAVPALAECDPSVPGQIPTIPCSAAQPATEDSTDPGQTDTPPASDTVDVIFVAEVALKTLLLF